MAVEAGCSNVFLQNHENSLSDFVALPDQRKVHNHLLDTQIYTTLGENEIFHVRPSVIHFEGFEAGGRYYHKVRIINASGECQRMHIIPPATDVFNIIYNKMESLVPGMYLEVLVEFTPEENRYHCDCIRIHAKGTCNLIVPIHAYLVMNIPASFPNKVYFQPTLVGQTAVKKVVFKNDAAADFDFQIGFVEKHSAFSVEPMSGIIAAHGRVNILISYTPMEYCTACAKIQPHRTDQIMVSQFNCQPFYCTLTGSSQPGLASKLKLKQLENHSNEVIDARVQNPLERSRSKKFETVKTTLRDEELKDIVIDGIRFPRNLNNPSAVAYVLTQQPGKMRAKDVKNAVKSRADTAADTKQMKEAIFDHLVNKSVTEEQRNQLRWCIKLGENSTTELFQLKTIKDRSKAVHEYQVKRGDPQVSKEFCRTFSRKKSRRIRRLANEQTETKPTFDLFLNDEWQQRHMILKRFIYAARKVIIRLRASKSLSSLHQQLDSWRRGQFISAPTKFHEKTNKEQLIVENLSTEFDSSKIKPFAFPVYNDPVEKDDMAVDALGLLPVPPTNVIVKSQVQMYDLKVPQQYKILSYHKHPFTSAAYRYVPKKLARELRTGAESELTQVEYKSPEESSTQHATPEIKRLEDMDLLHNTSTHVNVPSSFLQQKDYHPLHIFNPLPGVQAHPQALPYSEVDEDYKLNPLLRTQSGKLDRQGVIPGLMSWKKFPCQGLVVMNKPTLCNVYVPRWTDPFGEELMPTSPPLLQCLPEDDAMESDEDENDSSSITVPTMDMIRAEFKMVEALRVESEESQESCSFFPLSLTLPTNNNPQSKMGVASREKMICDLDIYLRKKQNNLGGRIKTRIESIQTIWKLKK